MKYLTLSILGMTLLMQPARGELLPCSAIKDAFSNVNETMFLLEVAKLQIRLEHRQKINLREFIEEYEGAVSHYDPRLTRRAQAALDQLCSVAQN